jgi:hypothetical protein
MTGASVLKSLKRMAEADKDSVLDLIGLEERRTASDRFLPVLAMFGVGLLVGVGVGMMLAPKAGRELRDDMRQTLNGGLAAAKHTETQASPLA